MSTSMKLLLTVGLLVLLGGAAVWIYGGKKQHYETDLTINATPGQIYSYLTDTEQVKKWVDGLMDVEPINELVGQEGARARVTRNENGKVVEFEDEILRREQDKLLSVRLTNSTLVTTSIYKLEPKNEQQTVFRYTVKSENVGLGRFLAPFGKDETQMRIEKDAQNLKELVEKQIANGTSGAFSESAPIGAGG